MNTEYNGERTLNMAILLRSLRQRWNRRRLEQAQTTQVPASFHPRKAEATTVDIAPDDPIVAHFLSAAGAVEVDKLHLDSPALLALKSADVKLAVPLVSQGELVGLLTLGPRLSEQQYSAYDRQLLNSGWEQEDDVTLVTLQRLPAQDSSQAVTVSSTPTQDLRDEMGNTNNWHILGQWLLASEPGNERIAMEKVAEAVRSVHLSTARLERLKTAVAEATMNAMEHGNSYRADRPVSIQVRISKGLLSVTIGDRGGTRKLPTEPEIPDIEAKLAELQTPRGWGLFLIKNMVDDMHITSDESHHTLELILYLEGENHDG